jgi:hypothetical protein
MSYQPPLMALGLEISNNQSKAKAIKDVPQNNKDKKIIAIPTDDSVMYPGPRGLWIQGDVGYRSRINP